VELSSIKSLLLWSKKRWLVASSTAVATGLFISLPTAILKTPIFGREIEVTPWSVPVVIATSILSGMLFATYIKMEQSIDEDRSLKVGGAGALFSFLAVGCPVCNKLVLVALGYSGAIQYFAPVQPYLAAAGILLLAYALQRRLAGEAMCQVNFVEKKQEQRLEN
jgi:hypothetical protein